MTDIVTEGRIVNMPAFFAFLNHIYATLSPTLHTPVMLIAQPAWTAKNQEDITGFIFEKFKTPALCIMDSALATSYAYGAANATIVDVGFEKVDVTAITEYQISGRGCVPASGGEGMTKRLQELLQSKSFTREMAEQLKKSPICEILSPGTPLPGSETTEPEITNPAAAATTGALSSGPGVRITEAPRDVEIADEEEFLDDKVDDDGVLDVASIVTSGKTQEFLAKKEKEKQEKSIARKAAKDAREAAEAAAAKPVRLPNSKRPRAIFHYEETIQEPSAKRQKTPEAVQAVEESAPVAPAAPAEVQPDEAPLAEAPVVDGVAPPAVDGQAAPADAPADAPAPPEDEAARREQVKAARKEEKRKAREEEHPDRVRTDFEIGLERFQAAGDGYLESIADTIYRTVLKVDEIARRQDAWDSLIICGQGAKVRGFKDALLSTLSNHYLVSPSSATMFMSELPSNLATPSGTGSMTPTASFSATPHQLPHPSSVNPLLIAATTASIPGLNPNQALSHNGGHQTHSSHSQSPSSIKVASPPTYFPEWKSFDEAVFLGAQVAAKVIFVVDQGVSKGFLSRQDFNEEGPSAIHQV